MDALAVVEDFDEVEDFAARLLASMEVPIPGQFVLRIQWGQTPLISRYIGCERNSRYS